MMGHKMMKQKRKAHAGVELSPPPFENSGPPTPIRGSFVIDCAIQSSDSQNGLAVKRDETEFTLFLTASRE